MKTKFDILVHNACAIFNIPAWIFHELCHILMLLSMYRFIRINFKSGGPKIFLENKMIRYKCPLSFASGYIIPALLIVTAPLIGYIIGLIILMILVFEHHNIIAVIIFQYFIIAMYTFKMSETDTETFNNTLRLRINKK